MTESAGARLRQTLSARDVLLLPGAYDVLSARLLKQIGFEAIWAGGFVASATMLGLPDASYITLEDQLQYARRLASVSDLPVVVDCDGGYGNAVNVVRTVREFERAGAAAVQIEDQDQPKRCALFPGRRAIVSKEEMVGKIRAAVDTRREDGLMIWARTDAFNAGLSLNEALDRAHAYVEAGADVIVPISKDLEQLRAFGGAWEGSTPLCIAPTLFPHLTSSDVGRIGYKIEVVALVAAFAAVKAMEHALRHVRAETNWEGILADIATFEQFTKLVGLPEVARLENAYLPAESDLVGVAARGLTEERP
jgi:2-methylisocitrate lyase-like PEP mutase family enzyme